MTLWSQTESPTTTWWDCQWTTPIPTWGDGLHWRQSWQRCSQSSMSWDAQHILSTTLARREDRLSVKLLDFTSMTLLWISTTTLSIAARESMNSRSSVSSSRSTTEGSWNMYQPAGSAFSLLFNESWMSTLAWSLSSYLQGMMPRKRSHQREVHRTESKGLRSNLHTHWLRSTYSSSNMPFNSSPPWACSSRTRSLSFQSWPVQCAHLWSRSWRSFLHPQCCWRLLTWLNVPLEDKASLLPKSEMGIGFSTR